MQSLKRKKVIVITGPTASGKSALAVDLAKILGSEVISADSRQIYKEIPIVTAVPSIEERKGVNHHLIEILNLEDYYSAAKFVEDAEKILDNILEESDTAIVCGGSMLYLDALTKGIDMLPTVPQKIRSQLMEEWKENGNDWLIEKLKNLDKSYYKLVDLRNLKRVFHAVEISITAGVPYSSLLSRNRNISEGEENDAVNISFSNQIDSTKRIQPYEFIKICLTGDRELLFERINARVLRMMESGLEEEARRVYHKRHLNSLNTVGLKEMFQYFDGNLSREEAISRIQKNTRVYAKKQLTWHKRDKEINYLDISLSEKDKIDFILSLLRK
ncbi:MAG: tRNA (adenosine(37)-N6)-dimethylallyltransferase MiaA [Muribaculaceae bacterium]|nr:tRNA (adenosine(37)-N6)-dimethylallyltransferase MiaA [Muribaculaceae bacterium]